MPGPRTNKQSKVPISIRERLRAHWIVLRNGPRNAWTRAINSDDPELGRALLSLGVSAREMFPHALMRAVGQPGAPEVSAQVLDLVLKAGADPNTQYQNNYWDRLLHRAVVQGREDKVWVLLANGADPNALDGNHQTPLVAALVGFGEGAVPFSLRQPLVSVLLKAGSDPQKKGKGDLGSILSKVPMENPDLCLQTFEQLISHGADPMQAGTPPSQGHRPVVGNEPALLFRATEIHKLDFLDKFLTFMEKYGQGPQTRGSHGQTLAHELIKAWHPIPGGDGAATAAFYEEVLNLLSQRGHDLAAQDNDGNTLWHSWAKASVDYRWTADALLAHPITKGLSLEENKEGQTALDILRGKGLQEDSVMGQIIARLTQDQMGRDISEAPSSGQSLQDPRPRSRL